MKPIAIFRGTTGLNTVDDPTRLPSNKSGIQDIAEAVNITIDRSYRPSTRKGFDVVQQGNYHSLYCDGIGGECFISSGDAIFQINSDYSLTGLRSGMTEGARVCFKTIGNSTYYGNGFERGIINGGVSRVWSVGAYHGADTNRLFEIPEGILHLEHHAGRLFASVNNVLYWSEPFRYDLFCLADSFVQFNTKIRLVRSVTGGLFIGTEKNTYFLTGNSPQEFGLVKVANFAPIEWTDSYELIEGVGIRDQISGLCVVWASTEGAILGTASGQMINLNKNKIIYPENVTTGFGGLIGYHFIHGVE